MRENRVNQQNVLVWGGLGFMGQHLVQLLLSQGARVSLLTRARDQYPTPEWAGEVKWFELSPHVDSRRVLREAVSSASLIFDFAGSSGAMASNRDPIASLEANCRSQLDFLLACEQAGHRPHVVFASSWLVYGDTKPEPIDENHPVLPASMYASHKLCIENYLRIFARGNKITYTVCRISNPYGFDPAKPGTTYKVLNLFIQQALAGLPIRLFGSGQQLRDFIYISDVVDGLISCGLMENARNQVFNLSSGASHSMRTAVEMIGDIVGTCEIRHQPWPPEYLAVESGDYLADVTKAKTILGFAPVHDLRSGLEKTVQAYRKTAAGELALYSKASNY